LDELESQARLDFVKYVRKHLRRGEYGSMYMECWINVRRRLSQRWRRELEARMRTGPASATEKDGEGLQAALDLLDRDESLESLDEDDEALKDRNPGPAEECELADRRERAREALLWLSKKDRPLAVAVLCDGKSVAKWARDNGVSPGIARRRLARITKQLR